MKITNKYMRMALDALEVDRDTRQRKDIDVSDLLESIGKYGVFTPIIVEPLEGGRARIIAGERRYTASRQLGLPDIPVRFIGDLSPIEAKLIELEENLRRKDLSWRDHTRAIAEIHKIHIEADPDWTQAQTAKVVQLDTSHLGRIFRVAQDLDNPKIADADGLMAAHNILSRLDARKYNQTLEAIIGAATQIAAVPTTAVDQLLPDDFDLTEDIVQIEAPADALPRLVVQPLPAQAETRTIIPAGESLIHGDFLEWAPAYTGPRFNFLHCDFPYGINFNAGTWGRESGATRVYDDSPDTYWQLCRCLADNIDRICTPSAHIMFWFSMDYYQATLDFFAKETDFVMQKFPLYWAKTDNVGILPDHKRGPRRVVETALMGARGDRFIVKSVSNFHGGPTAKSDHQSAKPEPMLHHFFEMFVDETTRMLDPTCGGGSALRAAERHGAEYVFGIEYNAENAAQAQSSLRKFRELRYLNK